MRRASSLAAVLLLTALPLLARPPLLWHPLLNLQGVFDVGGPMPDGRLVLAGSQGLFLADQSGATTRFAPAYGGQSGEAYLAVSPGLTVERSGCAFPAGAVFVLRLGRSKGVIQVDPDGQVHNGFATLSGTGTPNGIAFDTTGRFGHRLLVTVGHGRSTSVDAVDCRGVVATLTRSAPVLEGGLAVAPAGFRPFGGALIAPDELSGRLIAIQPDGHAATVVESGLTGGQDIGVESLGFVPSGFAGGGAAFVADRATGNSAHPGSDHLQRVSSSELLGAGVREGDLLVATEGGDRMIDVRCSGRCRVVSRLTPETPAHGEGHLLVVADHARSGALP